MGGVFYLFRQRPKYLVKEIMDVLHNFFHCDMEHMDKRVLANFFNTKWHKSKKLGEYQSCFRRLSQASNGSDSKDVARQCEGLIQRPCLGSEVRVTKVIRLLVREALLLCEREPDVKVIFYVRDPRGILLSRWNVALGKNALDRITMKKVHDTADFLCARMVSDLLEYQRLKSKFPDNVIRIQYEDLAERSEDTVADVYRFLGKPLPQEVLTWIRQATHAQRNDGQVGSHRLNSTATAERWSREIPRNFLQAVNSHCQRVYKSLGYPTDIT